jgi:uncharacterized SAM-binding protein YcdF (DUF218 family)
MLALTGAVLFVLSAACVIAFGQTYTVELKQNVLSLPIPEDLTEIGVDVENEDPGARITETVVQDDAVRITFASVKRGQTVVEVSFGGEPVQFFRLFTHSFGVLTYETVFGDSTGDLAIPIAMLLFLVAAIWFLIGRLRANVQHSMYQYRNVLELGLIVFLCFFLLCLIWQGFNYQGFVSSVDDFLEVIHGFSVVVLPAAFVLSILVAVSSISLMRREVRTWRNMLGVILGVGLCLLTLVPGALGEYLQWSPNPILDVHNERGAGLYIEIVTEGVISMLVSYLECILIGTIVFSVMAARRIPAYDKDYMLIHGCQIKDDGTLTPLLRSRADRALEFARAQKEKTGRDLTFVPSGGQGPDEVMSEAESIKNYLVSVGVPEERILIEDRSANTRENIANSMALIASHAGTADVKAAFSTTNYHVFRAGMIAETQGYCLEGIGSPTKRYFWINAFVREFIATLVSERRKHILVIAGVTLMIVVSALVKYFSATI